MGRNCLRILDDSLPYSQVNEESKKVKEESKKTSISLIYETDYASLIKPLLSRTITAANRTVNSLIKHLKIITINGITIKIK